VNGVLNIAEVFSGRLFRVPDYQRSYAWERHQLLDFLEDLRLLPEGKDHYTGTLILHSQKVGDAILDESGTSYARYHIVDGQQRLTTIVLLLDAIQRELSKIDDLATVAVGIEKSYLAVNNLNKERIFKLELNADTHQYFVSNVLEDPPGPGGPETAAHQRLHDAKKYFREHLASKRKSLKKEYPQWLLGLFEKVAHRLRVTLYTVEEESDVGVIFEAMNNRGKQLSEMEKVKNYLLYVGSKLQLEDPNRGLGQEVNDVWSRIFKRLLNAGQSKSTDEDHLLRAHWLMAYEPRSRHWKGYDSVKSRFNMRQEPNHMRLLGDLKQYTRSLDQASIAFCDIYKPTLSSAFSALDASPQLQQDIVHFSEKLCRIKVVATFLPLLMAVRIRYPEEGEKYLEMVRFCETFAFRVYMLRSARERTRSDVGQKVMFHAAHQLYTDCIGYDEAIYNLRSELFSFSPNHLFEGHFRLKDEENDWYGWNGLKYLLYEYEEYLAGNDTVQLPWDAVARCDIEQTIEHILPQVQSYEYWTKRFDKSAQKALLHDLGNLCLTTHNAAYGNRPFPDKKGSLNSDSPCYCNSNLYQERELARYDDWDADAIRNRRERIVNWAMQRWHVDENGLTD